MKVPTFKLKEVEAPWTRWHRQFNDWAARKEAEAAARKAKEAQERAELEAERARAAAVPIPVGVPSNAEEVAALRDRLEILENAWNAFHQAQVDRQQADMAARGLVLARDDQRFETLLKRVDCLERQSSPDGDARIGGAEELISRLDERLRAVEGNYVSLDVVVDESTKLQRLVADLQVGNLRADMARLRDGLADARKATAGKAPGLASADIDGLRKQLEALKLKLAAIEAADEATRAGLLALQEKQDADEANLKTLREELEMEVVATPK